MALADSIFGNINRSLDAAKTATTSITGTEAPTKPILANGESISSQLAEPPKPVTVDPLNVKPVGPDAPNTTPMSDEEKAKQASIAASIQGSADAGLAAATKVGEEQQKTQASSMATASDAAAAKPPSTPPPPPVNAPTPPAAPAETTKKTTKSDKQVAIEDATLDMISDGLKTIKSMADGGDPTITAQFNSWINKFATSSASARSALMMNLRSDPGYVAGSGEGTAALLMLSRGTNTTMADMIQKMSVANVQFIMDANKLGIEKAIEVRKFFDEEEGRHLANQISELAVEAGKINIDQANFNLENSKVDAANKELSLMKDLGQYDKVAELLNKRYPGLNVSAASIRSADPATINAMTSQKESIKALVDSGNADAAKKQAIAYYSQFWQNEGFKSQEEAIAFANSLDFSPAAFKARTDYITNTSTAVRTYAVQKNTSAGKAAVAEYYKAIGRDPADVGAGLSVAQVNEMRKFFDPAAQPVSDLTAEDKSALGIDWEWYQQSKGASGARTVGTVYNSFAEAAKNAGTPFDAEQERYVKAWINDKMLYGGITVNPDSPNGFDISKDGTTMPWDNPQTSFYFTTWPKYDFSKEPPELLDAGGQRYTSTNSSNYGSYTAAEDKRLDDAYLAYLHDPRRDPAMTREKWYESSKGGTIDIIKNPPAAKPAVVTNFEEGQVAAGTLIDKALAMRSEADRTKIKADVTASVNVANSLPADKIGGVPDTATNRAMILEASENLKSLGITSDILSKHFDRNRVGDFSTHDVYNASQVGMDYAIYYHMVKSGVSAADAMAAMVNMVGDARAKTAISLEQGSLIKSATTASLIGSQIGFS